MGRGGWGLRSGGGGGGGGGGLGGSLLRLIWEVTLGGQLGVDKRTCVECHCDLGGIEAAVCWRGENAVYTVVPDPVFP